MVSVTERVQTLFFSPLQPRNAGGGGGVGGVSRARFPPGPPHLRSSDFQNDEKAASGPQGPGPKPAPKALQALGP